MALIELDELEWASGKPDFPYIIWKRSLPFVSNPRGVLSHRARIVYSTRIFEDEPAFTPVTHVIYWCGSTSRNLEFHAVPPETNPLCARCEKQAIEAGKPPAELLANCRVWIGGARDYHTEMSNRFLQQIAAVQPGCRVQVVDKQRIHYGNCGTVRQYNNDGSVIVDFDNGDGAGVYMYLSLKSITTQIPPRAKGNNDHTET